MVQAGLLTRAPGLDFRRNKLGIWCVAVGNKTKFLLNFFEQTVIAREQR